ncbi:MAG: hypothetical protein GY798_00630, partial [Hyphomicrobiales bacterium]|nr:hypothetical protein [Hyphomicrobiales bacterium]
AGTTVGFAVSAAVLVAVGGNTSGLWWLLPIMVFLAGYAPGAIGFSVGQVAFTVMVVCLFDIFDPQGISTAIVRLEAVSLGAVSAAAVALIFWPRGARAALARATAAVYRASAEGLKVVLATTDQEHQRAATRLEAATERATSAFVVALGERGEHIDSAAWAGMSRPPSLIHALLCGLHPAFPAMPPSGCTTAADAVRHQVSAATQRLTAIADRLEAKATAAKALPNASDAKTVTSLNNCLRACAGNTGGSMQDALVIMGWNRWLDRIDKDLQQAEKAQADVVDAASGTGWLRWSLRPKTTRPPAASASVQTGSVGPAKR